MKTIILFSSIFFLLGLKISSIIDLRGKAKAVDEIITQKIMESNPVKALPLFPEEKSDEEEKKPSGEKSDSFEKNSESKE